MNAALKGSSNTKKSPGHHSRGKWAKEDTLTLSPYILIPVDNYIDFIFY